MRWEIEESIESREWRKTESKDSAVTSGEKCVYQIVKLKDEHSSIEKLKVFVFSSDGSHSEL